MKVNMASGKYSGLAQLVGGFANSFKEKCARVPVDWCCVGFNDATADGMVDGSYDLWLQSEQLPCLQKYEQKPLVGDINFNSLDKLSTSDPQIHNSIQGYYSSSPEDVDDDVDDGANADDIPLNSYLSSPIDVSTPSSSKYRSYRMRFGVRRGFKRMSRKLRKDQKEKRLVPNVITLQDHHQASKYPSQELSRAPFLYPLKEEGSESSADDDGSIGSSTRLV